MMKFYIPNNLDIDKHIIKNPVNNIKPFKIIYLVYILNQLAVQVKYDNSNFIYGEYFPLSAKKMQLKIHNYNQYLDYAIRTKIIETDNFYIKGLKTKGYKFSKEYSTTIK